MTLPTTAWRRVCQLDDILPGTGVCALIEDCHIAIFRLGAAQCYAIDNIDPKSGASVLSRGLIGNLGEQIVVASPLYKHHFDLQSGACLEMPEHAVRSYPVRCENNEIFIQFP